MKQLWAPWRKVYIRPEARPPRGCLFCGLVAKTPREDRKNYVLKRTPSSFAVLNLYPYNNGHVLVVPRRHVRTTHALTAEEKLDWLGLCEEILDALKAAMKPHAFNVGGNLGKGAGAGIPGHFHMHIVPRWNGDTNFMPVLTDTKLISESLDSVYHALLKKLK